MSILITLFFDCEYILSYGCIWLMLVTASHSKEWEKYVQPLIVALFFREKHKNRLLTTPTQIKTYEKMDEIRKANLLKQDKLETQKTTEEYGIKDKNLWGKIRDFRSRSAITLKYLEELCDVFEKSKK